MGGAIAFDCSKVQIENSAFIENYMASQRNNNNGRGGALYFKTLNAHSVNIHNCSFINNTISQRAMHICFSGGGAIAIIGELSPALFINPSQPQMAITLSLCEFHYNRAERGGALLAIGVSILKVFHSHFTNNKNGAIMSLPKGNGYMLNVSSCRFSDNEGGMFGGAIIVEPKGRNHSTFIHNSIFISNKAGKYGGAIYVSTEGPLFAVSIDGCSFGSNVAGNFGGAVHVLGHPWMKHVIFNKCHFVGNTAEESGGAISSMSMTKNAEKYLIILSSFKNNYAPKGGAVYAGIVTLIINDSNFTANVAYTGVIYCIQSEIEVRGKVMYALNNGSLFVFGSTLNFAHWSHFWADNNYSPTHNNGILSFQEGGVITMFQSNIYLHPKSNYTFLYNEAASGRALHVVESNIFVYGHLHAMYNSATNSGGSMYLYQSQLTCEHQSFVTILLNKANKTGGGIHATNSVIKMHFTEYDRSELGPRLTYDGSYAGFGVNTAMLGSGLFLEVNSKFYTLTYNFVIIKLVKLATIQYNSISIQHYMEELYILQMKPTTVPVPAHLTWYIQPVQNVHFKCWSFLDEVMVQNMSSLNLKVIQQFILDLIFLEDY